MNPETAQGLIICAIAALLPVGVGFAVVVLRAACSILKMEKPELLPAMGIILLTVVVQGVVMFLLAVVASLIGGRSLFSLFLHGIYVEEIVLLSLYLPFSALTHAPIYNWLLHDCSMRKGFKVWSVQLGIILAVAIVLGLAMLLVSLVVTL
jgi:hypothetical protein